MKGTILSYDSSSESGLLEGEDGCQYDFYLSYCYGFSNAPAEGDVVEYGFEDGELYFVELSTDSTSSGKQASSVSSQNDVTQTKAPLNVDIHAPIPLNTTITESLNYYFSKIIVDLEEFAFDFKEHERLEFLQIRRFLFTAYRNLLDLDPRFVNNDLIAFYEYLTDLYHLYQTFVKRLRIPQSAYEEIFLSAQPEFIWRKERLDLNKGEMVTFQGVVKNITYKMDTLKRKMTRGGDEAASLESEYKRCNGMYVDALHRIATLRDENLLLTQELQAFEEAHYAEFVTEFTQFTRTRKEQILRLLDGYAYYFDKKMWECAEQSSSIREFFRKANVQEEFSSKTYLKYYLRGIDDLKMSALHKELKTLLSYLESLSQISVVVIDEDRESRSKLVKLLRLSGSDIKVSTTERVGLLQQRLKKEPVDLILLDINVKNPDIFQSIEMIRKIDEQRERKSRICLLAKNFTKEQLHQFTRLGIGHFILKLSPEKQLAAYVAELVSGLGVDQLCIDEDA